MKYIVPILILLLIYPQDFFSQSDSDSSTANSPISLQQLYNIIEDIDISGQWFLGYQSREINGRKENEFLLKRGYLTVEKTFSGRVSGRITQDISVDQEGDGEGDVELRLKYGYVRYKFNDFLVFNNSFVEFGLVHRPWIDFEQKINDYRVQGPMFLDRNSILSSADYGITFTTLFGGKVNEEYQQSVSSAYPGKFGSATFGIYNGGGYHAIENNQNKIFEGRLSLRPLPEVITGLQFNFASLFGKGNTSSSPDFSLNLFSLSFESAVINFLGSYIDGTGDQAGKLTDEFNNSYSTSGYSIFTEFKVPGTSFSLIGRYDELKYSAFIEKNYIAGLSYRFLGRNKLLIDYDLRQSNLVTKPDDYILEFTVELKF